MQFDPQLNALFLEPDFWYLLGISLIIADIFLGLNFFALAFGAGAILTGVAIDIALFPSWLVLWERAILIFSITSLGSLFALKRLVPQGEEKDDINKY